MRVAGLTQYRLAQLSAVPQPTIQRILSGETAEPKRSTMLRLAHALHLSLDALYNNAAHPAATPGEPAVADLADRDLLSRWHRLSAADRARIVAIIDALTRLPNDDPAE